MPRQRLGLSTADCLDDGVRSTFHLLNFLAFKSFHFVQKKTFPSIPFLPFLSFLSLPFSLLFSILICFLCCNPNLIFVFLPRSLTSAARLIYVTVHRCPRSALRICSFSFLFPRHEFLISEGARVFSSRCTCEGTADHIEASPSCASRACVGHRLARALPGMWDLFTRLRMWLLQNRSTLDKVGRP